MPALRHIHALLHTALLMLALAGIGHAHNHVCLDGMEPPALVHFEALGDHPAHDDHTGDHVDIEQELVAQFLLTKTFDKDSTLFLLSAAPTPPVPAAQCEHVPALHELAYASTPITPRPPVRGPPAFSRHA